MTVAPCRASRCSTRLATGGVTVVSAWLINVILKTIDPAMAERFHGMGASLSAIYILCPVADVRWWDSGRFSMYFFGLEWFFRYQRHLHSTNRLSLLYRCRADALIR